MVERMGMRHTKSRNAIAKKHQEFIISLMTTRDKGAGQSAMEAHASMA
jgi:hypothetical protein